MHVHNTLILTRANFKKKTLYGQHKKKGENGIV
jgi:hypothetical protein